MNKYLALAVVGWLASLTITDAQQPLSPSAMRGDPRINYLSGPTTDLVTRLNAKLRAGEVALQAEPTHGYLRSVLAALNVPVVIARR